MRLARPKMRSLNHIATCLGVFVTVCAANSNSSAPLSSHLILPANFKPPQVFQNINLLRNINLEKGYIKERINVVIENTDAEQQSEYYIPFKAEVIGKVGGLEVRDKKDPEKPKFQTEVVEYDPYRWVKKVLFGQVFGPRLITPFSIVQPNFFGSHCQSPYKDPLKKRSRSPTISSPP